MDIFDTAPFQPIREMADYVDTRIEKDKVTMINRGFIRLMDIMWMLGIVTGFMIMIATMVFMRVLLT